MALITVKQWDVSVAGTTIDRFYTRTNVRHADLRIFPHNDVTFLGKTRVNDKHAEILSLPQILLPGTMIGKQTRARLSTREFESVEQAGSW